MQLILLFCHSQIHVKISTCHLLRYTLFIVCYLCVIWGTNISTSETFEVKVTWMATLAELKKKQNTQPRIRNCRFLSPILPFTLILLGFTFLIHKRTEKIKNVGATASLLQMKLYGEVQVE